MNKVLIVCLALLAVALPGSSRATESSVLVNACDGDGDNALELCGYYVSGFLDGALLTDTAIINKVSREDQSRFFRRAYATRVGAGREPLPATALADFCMPRGEAADSAAMAVARHLGETGLSGEHPLQIQVYDAVKELFPCDSLRER
jgi:hypothetical protein